VEILGTIDILSSARVICSSPPTLFSSYDKERFVLPQSFKTITFFNVISFYSTLSFCLFPSECASVILSSTSKLYPYHCTFGIILKGR
jgi:hypothetical protein